MSTPQNKPLFEVHDEIELLALWRLVAEAKFQPAPDDADLWGSPYVHALAQRISDARLEAYRAKGDDEAVKRHQRWVASLPDNIVLPVIKAKLKKDAATKRWHERTCDQKIAYVRGCVAPFQAEAEFLDALIREAEGE